VVKREDPLELNKTIILNIFVDVKFLNSSISNF
jgi:hypothetical protein